MHQSQGRNRIYVVLGMARSGTSAITRGLQALGINLGHRLTPPCQWHPKGFWEDNDLVYQINEKLLQILHSDWESLQEFPEEAFSSPAITKIKDRAKIILTKRFNHSQSFGFKDPRTVRLLPFWQQVFAEMDVLDHYVIALRNPLAAAHSYQRLMGAELEKGLLLWVVHAYDALRYTHTKSSVVISFENLIQQPQSEMLRLKNSLNLDNVNEEDVKSYTSEFLNSALKHHDANLHDLANHRATQMAPLCVELFNLLTEMANDQLTFQSEQFMPRWQVLHTKMQKSRIYYDYMTKVFQERSAAQRYIKRLHKSRMWRMILPLRVANDFFRKRKIEARDARRLKAALEASPSPDAPRRPLP